MEYKTQNEFRFECRQRLYEYASMKREVRQWEQDLIGLQGGSGDLNAGIRSIGTNSDPTGRNALLLAEAPAHIQRKRKWIVAIDSAIAEIKQQDGGIMFGTFYIMRQVYNLDGVKRTRREKQSRMERVQKDCHISQRTLYRRLDEIISIVSYHSARLGLADK